MRIKVAAIGLVAALGGCATVPVERAPVGPTAEPVRINLIAFNDFHGNLQPPRQAIAAPGAAGDVQVPAGGAAYLATAVRTLREANPNSLVVSAGDLISASPLVSALFLDEPTIYAMNMIGLDYNAVGNHEFDRGRAELLRIANGGCERNTHREPCAIDPNFPGARFQYLAANVITETGQPVLPAYAIRSFGSGASEVKVALIGMTLEGTPAVVTPTGIAGLSFRDEADTVNALIPRLEAEGADVIVVLVHEGATTDAGYNAKTCEGLRGDLLPILSRLSPKVDVVVSGHTHNAYICDHGQIDPERGFLLTSAGQYGTLLTHIRLDVDPATGNVVSRAADNLIVQGEGYTSSRGNVATTDLYPRYAADPQVAALVARYAAAAEPRAARVVGELSGPATHNRSGAGETILGNLIADAQLAATRAPENGGAQIAFMNPGGVRAEISPAPNGDVTFGQLFATQPFGNTLVVKSFTGAQIKALLEQQWASGPNSPAQPMVLMPSAGFTYSYDLSRPAGSRIVEAILNGQPLRDDQVYRVTMNGFLASGGDSFTIFRDGTDQVGGAQDIDALEAYIAANRPLALPATNRIRNLTPTQR